MKTVLNKELLARQGVTKKQQKKLLKLYKKLNKLMSKAAISPNSDKPAIAEKLRKIEFNLQKNWNLLQDVNCHTYQFKLPGCTCLKIGNIKNFRMTKKVTVGCPYHSPKEPYKGIKITDKNTAIIKSDVTTSIDVHLRENNQYVNVILPNKHIVVVESNGEVSVYDHTDTSISLYRLSSK